MHVDLQRMYNESLIYDLTNSKRRYNRASKGAYQKWADEVGDTAYTWDKFNPYMKKSVSFTPPNIELRGQNTSDIMFDATAFNAKSNSAPLQVSYAHFASPLSTWMKLGWQSLGK